ncbi:hypothetical protein R6Q57_018586, partial [Mikania cordata]
MAWAVYIRQFTVEEKVPSEQLFISVYLFSFFQKGEAVWEEKTRRYWNNNLEEIMEAGVHFGHHTRKWNPKMAPYISTKRKVSLSAQQSSFVVGVLSDLYAFHRSTRNSLCPYRTPACCWHRVSPCLFTRYRHCFFSREKSSRPVGLLPPPGFAPSGFRPLQKIPHCCLPPMVADPPLGPAIDHLL